MPSFIVPFRGAKGKSRLAPLPGNVREALARAMLADVLAACTAAGPTFVVGPDELEAPGVTLVSDPGGGQGPAVRTGLDAAALEAGGTGPLVVVNADLPCATARDLLALVGAVPDGGLALVPAADGTTNALALASPDLFVPLYGAGSAERFAALAPSRTLRAPNLVDDVDTAADLDRLRSRLGPRTRGILSSLRAGAAV